ncbi:hypothetical protein BN946_scf184298.g24 [Trametes cinnabarina]|uniref:Uncharacterized protein n=1 Tax=Pycnoporus cinnabarinus TaxID=5643 RepID=A0A060SR16_PYCCI|nr:hypothetical protein BN946_scf184298.g24 [Trametes cinnabarina]
MPSKLSFLSFSFTRDAGRRRPTRPTSSSSTSDRINLADYTDPAAPPASTGWTWCDSMNVWLPDSLPLSSGLLFGNPFACNRCRSANSSSDSSSTSAIDTNDIPSTRPTLRHRLTSRENWRLPGAARRARQDREIVNDGSVPYNQRSPAVVRVPAASPGNTFSSFPFPDPQGAARDEDRDITGNLVCVG